MTKRLSAYVLSALCLGLVFGSCNKNKESSSLMKKSKQVTVSQNAASSNTEQKESQDIFSEFYNENENAAQNPSQKKSMQTISNTAPVSAMGTSQVKNSFDRRETVSLNQNGAYVIQVACVPSEAKARKMLRQLQELGIEGYIAEVDNPTPELTGHYYRVRFKGFASIDEAKAFGENTLVPSGIAYWVDRKKNDNRGLVMDFPQSQSEPANFTPVNSLPSTTDSGGSNW